LGKLFLKNNQFSEAEIIYNEDLSINRQNGWSLIGLHQSLMAQGKFDEAKKIKQEFDEAWKYSDVKIDSSIL